MTTTDTAAGKGSGTREKVLDKLAETPGTTAGEIAEAAGLGRSTVNKALAKLEGEGAARREPGGRDGKTKLPDRWHPTAGGEGTTDAEQEQPVSADSETVDTPETEAIAEPSGDGDTGPADNDQDEAVSEAAAEVDQTDAPDTDTDTEDAPASESTRLGRGVLAGLALNYLAERPTEELTASAVGKALGRSAGAVANAFTKYAETGHVTQTCAKPRRYRINLGGPSWRPCVRCMP